MVLDIGLFDGFVPCVPAKDPHTASNCRGEGGRTAEAKQPCATRTFLSFASWMFAAASSTHMSSPCFAESKALWNLEQ
jgi:hypothetical protein